MSESFLDGKVTLHRGDCLEVLREIPENSVDSVCCDPPYHLTSIVKRFGSENAAPCQEGNDGRFRRLSGGFMGRSWDAPEVPAIDPCFANWFAGFVDGEGCFSVHKKTVNNCETYDCQFSMTLRADDKPIIVDIQKKLGAIGTIANRPAPKIGNGKPQARYCISSQADCQRLREILLAFPLRAKKLRDFEIWCHALDAWLAHEPGSSWEDVAYFRDALMAVRQYGASFHPSQLFYYRFARAVYRVMKPGAHLVAFGGCRTYHRLASAVEDAGFEIRDMLSWNFGSGFPKSHNLGNGLGTALKPAHEPICLARKPLSESSIAANVLRWGTGAINIDGCRVATSDGYAENAVTQGINTRKTSFVPAVARRTFEPAKQGRWPANLIHDGSEEVMAGFPESGNGYGGPKETTRFRGKGWKNTSQGEVPAIDSFGDSGSAARFFYTAKADAYDRLCSKHPTVKPVDLIQYLVRLVTPRNGVVLDPFAGTGTTAEAAWREGMSCILIEREPEYQADIVKRMGLCLSGPDTRRAASVKQQGHDDLPMFASIEP